MWMYNTINYVTFYACIIWICNDYCRLLVATFTSIKRIIKIVIRYIKCSVL